jgi:hypothetical protein
MDRGPAAAVPLEGGAWLRADDRNRAKTTRWPASCLYSLERTGRPRIHLAQKCRGSLRGREKPCRARSCPSRLHPSVSYLNFGVARGFLQDGFAPNVRSCLGGPWRGTLGGAKRRRKMRNWKGSRSQSAPHERLQKPASDVYMLERSCRWPTSKALRFRTVAPDAIQRHVVIGPYVRDIK